MKRVFACGIVLSMLAVAAVSADIKTQQKSQVKFAGMLGSVVNFFGGKSSREGVTETVVVSGNRKATIREDRAEIIDLAEEKVYDVDLKGKSYKVTTFDEIRRKMQEAQEKAKKDAERAEERKAEKSEKPEKELQVDLDVKDTGQRKTINGFDCRQFITTVTVHEKGKSVQESGGLLMTADSWLAPRIPGMQEIIDFDMRYMQKITGINPAVAAEQMAAALAMYPGLKDAMAKMQASNVKMDGTPIQTTTTVDAAKSAEQAAQEKDQKAKEEPASASGGVGGMLGGLGRRIARKKDDQPSGDKDPNRATIMTINHEVLSVATSIDPSQLTIPAGFKQK
jgi:hypothetical protein